MFVRFRLNYNYISLDIAKFFLVQHGWISFVESHTVYMENSLNQVIYQYLISKPSSNKNNITVTVESSFPFCPVSLLAYIKEISMI